MTRSSPNQSMPRATEGRQVDAVVSLERDGNIGRLELGRPHRLNALNRGMHLQLQAALEEVRHDERLRVLVITGRGRAFCAGGDVKDMLGRPQRYRMIGPALLEARETERKRLEFVQTTFLELVRLPVPVVAAVNGLASGSGLSLLLAADYRVSSSIATFRVGFTDIGLPGDGGVTALLPAVIGQRAAARWLMFGGTVDAAQALELGLVDEVAAEADVLACAARIADQLAMRPKSAIGALRARLLLRADFEAQLQREIDSTLLCQETEEYDRALASIAAPRPSRDRDARRRKSSKAGTDERQ